MQDAVPALAQTIARKGGGVRLRYGVVQTDNGDGTVDITLGGSGISIPSVGYLGTYSPTASDTVAILASGSDLLILGALA